MPQISTIKNIKQGEFIQLLNKDRQLRKKVWIRGTYDRSLKKYELQNYWDINDYRYVKGDHQCVIADI